MKLGYLIFHPSKLLNIFLGFARLLERSHQVNLKEYNKDGKIVPTFPGSSMVEQEAVNFKVAGSNPARGAKPHSIDFPTYFCYNYTYSLGLEFALPDPIKGKHVLGPLRMVCMRNTGA